MQTTKIGDYVVLHNGNFEGDVIVRHLPNGPYGEIASEVTVPFTVMLDLVLRYLAQSRIAQLEQMDASELHQTLFGSPHPDPGFSN